MYIEYKSHMLHKSPNLMMTIRASTMSSILNKFYTKWNSNFRFWEKRRGSERVRKREGEILIKLHPYNKRLINIITGKISGAEVELRNCPNGRLITANTAKQTIFHNKKTIQTFDMKWKTIIQIYPPGWILCERSTTWAKTY